MVEITEAEQNKEKITKRSEDSLRDLWDNIKHNNIRIKGSEKKKKNTKKYLRYSQKNSLIGERKQPSKYRKPRESFRLLLITNTHSNYDFGIISIANPLFPHPFKRQLQYLACNQGLLHQQFSKFYLYFMHSMFKLSLSQVPDAGLDTLQWKVLSCKIIKGKC